MERHCCCMSAVGLLQSCPEDFGKDSLTCPPFFPATGQPLEQEKPSVFGLSYEWHHNKDKCNFIFNLILTEDYRK